MKKQTLRQVLKGQMVEIKELRYQIGILQKFVLNNGVHIDVLAAELRKGHKYDE